MKQEIKQALYDAAAGIEDKSGINAVTILTSNLQSDPNIDYQNLFVESLTELLDELDLPNDKLWYQVQRVVTAFGHSNQALASKIGAKLVDNSKFTGSKGKYDAWRAFAVANGGLTPFDINVDEAHMKLNAPGLWLDLLLLAHSNDDEEVLTGKIIDMISGKNPKLGWERFRSKTTEIRKAYPDLRAFRGAIQKIAPMIQNKADRLEFLKAMDERLGTKFSKGALHPTPKFKVIDGGRPGMRLNSKTIRSQRNFAKTVLEPSAADLELA